MKPADGRCEEHGMYLYRTGFGWSCKLGCYYTDDPQKIKEGYIKQYKEELKDKINKKLNEKIKIWGESQPEVTIAEEIYQEAEHKVYKEILELLK